MKLELQKLSLQYDGKSTLFKDIDLTVESGDFVVIRGPSGSGKSSLLRLLNRLQEPTSGTILVDGSSIADLEVTRLRRRIGYVQQTPVIIDGTVRDNLQLPFTFKIASNIVAPDDDTLRCKLDAYLLQDVVLDEIASNLSVGQKQRLALIRVLLVSPEILLCDEPTSALDVQSRDVVERELERVNMEHGTSIVLVTHVEFQPKQVRPKIRIMTPSGLR